MGNGIPKRIITNYNNNEINNSLTNNNIGKHLFTNYTYKRFNFENNNLKINNIKNNWFDRKNIKTPIIRRCKTSNNYELNRIMNNINNDELKNNKYKKIYSINNKYIPGKLNIIQPKNDLTTKNINTKNNNYNNITLNPSSNSVIHSVTNDGSTVSIYGNTIHGLPIIQGVCSKCINNELIKFKNIHKKINEQRNNYTNYTNYKNILPKMYFTEKDKLIEQNSNAEFNLNKPVKERIKQKVINDFLKKEQYLKNKNKKLIEKYNMKLEVDKYLLNNNKISKFSIPCIGLEKFRNKYLPTKEEYINNLNEQIIEKKKAKEKEIKKVKDEFNFYANKKIEIAEKEEKSRINIEKEKLKEILKENIKFAEMKRNQELLDKSYDIALDKKNFEIIDKKDKENIQKQNNIKLKIRRDLKEKLDEQIKTKLKRNNSFDFRTRIKRINSRNIPDICDKNIYTENKINQYGRCLNCKKLFKKHLICPKSEYENIKKAEIRNEQEINKIIKKKI